MLKKEHPCDQSYSQLVQFPRLPYLQRQLEAHAFSIWVGLYLPDWRIHFLDTESQETVANIPIDHLNQIVTSLLGREKLFSIFHISWRIEACENNCWFAIGPRFRLESAKLQILNWSMESWRSIRNHNSSLILQKWKRANISTVSSKNQKKKSAEA